MRTCRMISCLVIAMLIGVWNVADAQPSLADHRYMVSEHTAVNELAGLLVKPSQEVRIRSLDVPEKVQVGDSAVYSVTANVETADLPITTVWQFPNTEEKRGLNVRHAFATPGVYDVTVRVANRSGSDESTFTVEVTEPENEL